ncbi:MAG: glycosyltransferase [Phycisphaerales bacterium]|nr:MAG: glycosyltransferase [Phycisphaerales bacterium]
MIDTPAEKRIALAHDWLVGLRGGEWVLDRLARLFGPTDLYTLVDDGRFLTEAISACRVVTSPLQRFPGAAGRLRRHYLPLMPWAVGRLKVKPCDLLISTSSAVMKSIRPPAGTPHLCYCHSPARYIWEQTSDYDVGAGGKLRGIGLRAFGGYLRKSDLATVGGVTKFLANSEHTAARIQRCYEREATVVYPPVRTDYFTVDESVPREDWLLVVAALEPYKRTDIVIEAANRAGFPLKVVGSGSQAKSLREMAGENVQLLGRVSDEELRDLYRRARGLLFPQVEDFGIIAVEAQATGCPVLAYAAGGAVETVNEQTGILFESQTTDGVIGAVEALEGKRIDPDACRRNAERFSATVFDESIKFEITELLS